MKKLADIACEQQTDRPTYFQDPAMDRMLARLLETAEEVCVLRDRLDTLHRLAASDQPFDPAAIDAFEVNEEEAARRLARHKAYFEDLLREL